MRPRISEDKDDIDLLFAQMKPIEPPGDLTARIMRALPASVAQPVVASSRTVPARRYDILSRYGSWISAAALVIFVLLSVHLGMQLDSSGTLGILGEVTNNQQTFSDAPGVFIGAILESMPWFDLILTAVALGFFWYSSSASVTRWSQQRGS
jgi:hypothetical protein